MAKANGHKRVTWEQISQRNAIATEEVPIERWGGTVLMRELAAEDALALTQDKDLDERGQMVALVAACLVDPELTVAQVDELMRGASSTFQLLIAAANRLNGFDAQAVERAEATFQEAPA